MFKYQSAFLLILLMMGLIASAIPQQAVLSPSAGQPYHLDRFPPGLDLLQTSIEELGLFLANGSLTSVSLVEAYLANIEKDNHQGLSLRAVIQICPRGIVLDIASKLDEERAVGHVRGPLHGIPMLVKDSIATHPELGMGTSAGNYALKESKVKRDAEVVRKLRDAGAIIAVIGKTNLNEFSGLKGRAEGFTEPDHGIPNGWSAAGGQTSSAYVEGGFAAGGNPEGSSSGSAVGVSAGFAAAALGTDAAGSVIAPAARAALFGIRPSSGSVSNEGIVPVNRELDMVGPLAFTARDAAIILDAMTFSDGRYLNATLPSSPHSPSSKSRPFRLGLVRKNFLDEADGRWTGPMSCPRDIEVALQSTADKLAATDEWEVLDVDMDLDYDDLSRLNEANVALMISTIREDLEAYMADLESSPVRTLRDVIEWNEAHACCQEYLLDGLLSPGRSNSSVYSEAWKTMRDLGGDRGMGYLFEKYDLDALLFSPDLGFSTGMSAALGYASGTAPLGYCESTGAPFGILFVVKPGEEEKLFAILAAYEALMPKRRVPGPMRGKRD